MEDKVIMDALKAKGYVVQRIAWSDKRASVKFLERCETKLVLIRAVWDYLDDFYAWNQWLSQFENVPLQNKEDLSPTNNAYNGKPIIAVCNTVQLLSWNLDKQYLFDLEKNGINIPPTTLIQRGEELTMARLCQLRKRKIEQYKKDEMKATNMLLFKPCVSHSALNTFKMVLNDYSVDEVEKTTETCNTFKSLVACVKERSMLMQEYQHRITEGEVSLIFVDGKFTHAVLKLPKKGDFRVHHEYGGTSNSYQPSPQHIQFGKKVLQACASISRENIVPTFARIDVITDNSGDLCLMELELLDPELWLSTNVFAVDSLSNAIDKLMRNCKNE